MSRTSTAIKSGSLWKQVPINSIRESSCSEVVEDSDDDGTENNGFEIGGTGGGGGGGGWRGGSIPSSSYTQFRTRAGVPGGASREGGGDSESGGGGGRSLERLPDEITLEFFWRPALKEWLRVLCDQGDLVNVVAVCEVTRCLSRQSNGG